MLYKLLRRHKKIRRKRSRRRMRRLLSFFRPRIPFHIPTVIPYVLPYIPMLGRPLSITYYYINRFWRLGVLICSIGIWDHVLHSLNKERPKPWLAPIGACICDSFLDFIGPFFVPLFRRKKHFLLPPLPPLPREVLPKTLILVVKDAMAQKTFTLASGMNLKKRPYLEEFIRKMGEIYELIIFSDEDAFSTDQLIQSLDPTHQLIAGKIGSESLAKFGPLHFFNWKSLNRDPQNVIVVDARTAYWTTNPRNLIYVSTYTGNEDDTTLLEMMPFLEHLSRLKGDVRSEIDKWGHYRGMNYWIKHVIERSKLKGNSMQLDDSKEYIHDPVDRDLITTGREHPIFGEAQDPKTLES